MPNKQIRVSPDKQDGGWRVHQSKADRDSAHTEHKQEAIDIAQRIARNQGGETKVQNRNGHIGSGNSYGNDPCPPKDRK